jgi:hypothetical protein
MIIVLCTLWLAEMIITMFTRGWHWIAVMMADVTDCGILLGIGIIFRLKGRRKNGCTFIHD